MEYTIRYINLQVNKTIQIKRHGYYKEDLDG